MRIALFEPDIPQNTGSILRLAACLGVDAHIIEPAGFPTSDRAFRRAGMDYLDLVSLTRHASWDAFESWRAKARARLIVLTTRATRSYLDHAFGDDDVLPFGPRIIGPAGKSACRRRCAAGNPDAGRFALAQRSDGGRQCGRRGVASSASTLGRGAEPNGRGLAVRETRFQSALRLGRIGMRLRLMSHLSGAWLSGACPGRSLR